MASNIATIGLIDLPDVTAQRIERDRALARAHLVDGTPVQEIVDATGINRRTVYRAIKRERSWAEAQKQSGPVPQM